VRTTRRTLLAGTLGAIAAGAGAAVAPPGRGDLESAYRALFGDRRPAPGDFELEVSQVVENGNSVAVRIAADPQDPPAAMHLFMPRNPERWGASFRFGPGALPEVATRVRLSMTQNLTAVAEWADGRLAARSVSVLVTLGACIDENFERWVRDVPRRPVTAEGAVELARADLAADHPGAGIGRARLRAPTTATAGERVELRTLVRHPMETGYRIDTDGARVPRNIVDRFRCTLGGETLLDAELRPAIAADPYLAFAFRAERSGELAFTWHEDRGATLRETRAFDLAAPP
jgi:thiosulfate oxidation carrier complex protein SoxZ